MTYQDRIAKIKELCYKSYRLKCFCHFAEYVDQLLERLFTDVVRDPVKYQQVRDAIQVPPNLCANFARPSESDFTRVVSRFVK